LGKVGCLKRRSLQTQKTPERGLLRFLPVTILIHTGVQGPMCTPVRIISPLRHSDELLEHYDWILLSAQLASVQPVYQ